MAGKTEIREKVKKLLYVDVADIVLLTKIEMGKDGYIKPEDGRKMVELITDRLMRFITPLEMLLTFLERRGYTSFSFNTLQEPYYKYEFYAYKPNDAGATLIKKGKTIEEAVYQAVMDSAPDFKIAG